MEKAEVGDFEGGCSLLLLLAGFIWLPQLQRNYRGYRILSPPRAYRIPIPKLPLEHFLAPKEYYIYSIIYEINNSIDSPSQLWGNIMRVTLQPQWKLYPTRMVVHHKNSTVIIVLFIEIGNSRLRVSAGYKCGKRFKWRILLPRLPRPAFSVCVFSRF